MTGEQRPNLETAHSFHAELQGILSTPLTPEIIGSYAEYALGEFIALVERVTEAYSSSPVARQAQGAEVERAAFAHFGLPDVGEALDHLASTAASIRDIMEVSGRIAKNDRVIVPPAHDKPTLITPGDGSFTLRRTVERLATTLFLLRHEFGVDVSDPSQITLTDGITTERMIRDTSYVAVDIPDLNRIVLVCDEIDNVTYVFDRDALADSGLDAATISDLTKPQLNALIQRDPTCGCRLVYTPNFVARLNTMLSMPREDFASFSAPQSSPSAPDKNGEGEFAPTYLYPPAPQGIRSVAGIQHAIGISYGTILRLVESLGETLGPVDMYRFGNKGGKSAPGYTEAQQELILRAAIDEGLLSGEAPEGCLSLQGFSENSGVTRNQLVKGIAALSGDPQFGEVGVYAFGATRTQGYTRRQQEQVLAYIQEHEHIAIDQAPTDYRSISDLVEDLGVTRVVLYAALRTIDKQQLGPVTKYQEGTQRKLKYSPRQQALIIAALDERGAFCEPPPEGVLSANGLEAEWGINELAIRAAIKATQGLLGPVGRYLFGTSAGLGYTRDQQRTILEYLAYPTTRVGTNARLAQKILATMSQ